MPRLRRLELHRFVGLRDSLVVFDTDDVEQAAELAARAGTDDVVSSLPVVTFGPDTLAEARNRGYRPPAG
jgi:hypothetical protein